MRGCVPPATRITWQSRGSTEIIASSPDGFREAVDEGLARAVRTLRNITGLEVIGKRIKVEHGQIAEYRVEMKVIFLLD